MIIILCFSEEIRIDKDSDVIGRTYVHRYTRASCNIHSTKTMTTLESPSPLPTVGTDKSDLDDKEGKVCQTSNGQVQHSKRNDSDPWAFLEHELEEFKRIVAELENLKLPANTIGNQGFC